MGNRTFPSDKGQSLSGTAAEQMAQEYLESQGLALIAKNFRTRRGDIDLIMLDNKVLVFVEVRFRRSAHFGSAEESITLHKCQRLAAAAQAYMQRYNLTEQVIARFDAVAISPSSGGKSRANINGFCLNWVRNILQ